MGATFPSNPARGKTDSGIEWIGRLASAIFLHLSILLVAVLDVFLLRLTRPSHEELLASR